MAIICPNVGEVILLRYLVNKELPTNLILHLFKNDITPDEETVIDDLVESDELGYSDKTLTGANWEVEEVEGTTSAIYPEQVFTFTEAANVYGYYITSSGGDLLWLELFNGSPFQLPSGGGTIMVTPKIELE